MPCLPLLLSGACLALALSNRLPASSPLMRMAYAPAPLVVPSSDFASELAYRTVTASTFAGAPLASYDPVTRAKVLTRWARRCDAEAHPEELIQDAVVGEDVNGNRRGPNMADYDWLRGKRRIACKSAQLTWEESNECWYLRFSAVKLQACDELLLTVITPEGVHLFRSDHRSQRGLSSAGKGTAATGKVIKFYGPKFESDWRVAFEALNEKLNTRATPVASARFDEPKLAATIAAVPLPFTASAYAGVPLADCSAKARGDVISRLVRRMDEGWLHPGATFEVAVAGEAVNGRRRGQNMAEYDWLRDEVRVACKSAQLKWDASHAYWKLQFSTVKLAACDELLLAAYTPEGVHLFRHDGSSGVTTNGKSTAATGQLIQFFGPRKEPDWRDALRIILDNVEEKGCRRLAFAPWDEQCVETGVAAAVLRAGGIW